MTMLEQDIKQKLLAALDCAMESRLDAFRANGIRQEKQNAASSVTYHSRRNRTRLK